MVSAMGVVVTVALNQTAVWVAAALLVLLIFSSYALRSLNLSVQAFSRRAADTVSGIVDALNTARDGTPSERAGKALRRHPPGEEVSQRHRNSVPRRRRARESLPEEIVWSISSTLPALAAALRDDVDEESRDAVARRARVLRSHINQALTQSTKTGEAPLPPGCCSRRSRCSEVARSSPNPSRRQGSWPPLHPRSSAPRNQRVTAPLLRPTQVRHRTVKRFRRRWRSRYRRSSPL